MGLLEFRFKHGGNPGRRGQGIGVQDFFFPEQGEDVFRQDAEEPFSTFIYGIGSYQERAMDR
jgi:hypothetical protein